MPNPLILPRLIKTFKSWPVAILDYLNFLPPKPLVYRLRNGLVFHTRARTLDNMVMREIWIYGEYIREGFEIRRDAIVVDIGGHIGGFSLQASRLAPEGKVLVLEPSPDNFALLQQNIDANRATNVTALNCAIMAHAGTRSIALCPNMVSNSMVIDYPEGRRVEVRAISLADLMETHHLDRIDFLKLDCEGAEFEILEQCPDEILAKINVIIGEVHALDGKRNREVLGCFLESKQFEVILDPNKQHMLFARKRGGPGNALGVRETSSAATGISAGAHASS